MKKLALVAIVAALIAGPALAFMSLRNCVMVSTMQGTRWIGTYCDAQGTCVKAMFTEYCPAML